jgi:hypothetical protein
MYAKVCQKVFGRKGFSTILFHGVNFSIVYTAVVQAGLSRERANLGPKFNLLSQKEFTQ